MIAYMQRYFSAIPPVFLDGLLYALIALNTGIMNSLSTDEAAKYLDPTTLFWSRSIVSWMLAVVGAIKMFRSTSFSEHQAAKKANGTGFYTIPVNQTAPPEPPKTP